MEWDQEESIKANEAAVDRIKNEVKPKTKEENYQSEQNWFEDGQEVRLLDGKKYNITPINLKKARRLMQILKTVNVDIAIMNYMPTENEELDNKRQEELLEMIEIAFGKYNLGRDYLEENIDVVTAAKIADILLGINGIKK
jgi:uncharacterized protein (DUF2344 family)